MVVRQNGCNFSSVSGLFDLYTGIVSGNSLHLYSRTDHSDTYLSMRLMVVLYSSIIK